MRPRAGAVVVVLGALGVALGAAGCGQAARHDSATAAALGAGALPPALEQAWGRELVALDGVHVVVRQREPTGSVRALASGAAAFATSVTALSGEQLARLRAGGREPLHIPLALAPLAIAYDLKQWTHRERTLASGLKLDAATLAVMFRGRIENWTNSRILARNRGLDVPDELITVCHRDDPAATTAVLSAYLSRRSRWWRDDVGSGERVAWKVIGGFHWPMKSATGDEGMVRCLQATSASLGYLDAADAARHDVTVAAVVNREGRFVTPTIAGAQAAAAAVAPPRDLRLSLLDAPGGRSYPITAVEYAIVWRDMCRAGVSADSAAAVKEWLVYALGDDGQRTARRLGYAPLPARLRGLVRAQVGRLRCNGATIPM